MKALHAGLVGSLLTIAACSSESVRGDPNGAGGASPVTTSAESSSSSSGAGGGGSGDDATQTAVPDANSGKAATMCSGGTFAFTAIAPERRSYASPARARALVAKGLTPPPSVVVEDEFLAYYAPASRVADPGAPSLSVALAAVPTSQRTFTLYALLETPPRPPLPTSITVVVDTALSLDGAPMEAARSAIAAIDEHLAPTDVLTIVTTATGDTPRKLAGHDPANAAVIAGLHVGPAGDVGATLAAAYKSADASFFEAGMNRVILVSDGAIPDAAIRDATIRSYALGARPIPLAVLDVGAPEESHAALARAARIGRGAYVFLDSVAEAKHMLGDRFEEVLGVAAREVTLDLEVPSFLSLRLADGALPAPDATALVPPDIGPGSVSVLRFELTSCDDFTKIPDALAGSIVATPAYREGDGKRAADTRVLGAPVKSTVAALLAAPMDADAPSLEAMTMGARAMHDLSATRLAIAEKGLCALFEQQSLSAPGLGFLCFAERSPLSSAMPVCAATCK